MKFHVRHFNLEGASNVRELGGYATVDGGKTAWGRFLRGDTTTYLTDKDKQTLKEWGLRTVIDLRGNTELIAQPNGFADDPDVNFVNCTMSNVDKQGQYEFQWPDHLPIDGIYAFMAEKAPKWLADVLKTIADAPEGGILFHCHAGKDRTGIIAALLLHLAGVSLDDIAADYMLTRTYYREALRHAEENEAWAPQYIHMNPYTMPKFFAHFENESGGMEAFLQTLPLPPDTLHKVRLRVIE